jgi:16S rRNA processing protein RimM
VRGELRLRPFNRDSELLLQVRELLVRLADGEERKVNVDSARRANDAILMRVGAVEDRNRADELRGALVCARRSDFPHLEAGEFYACDVEGACVVVDEGDGRTRELGHVRAIRTYPATDVLEVDATDGGRLWEVPLIDTIVRSVDVDAGLITLATMDGVERG